MLRQSLGGLYTTSTMEYNIKKIIFSKLCWGKDMVAFSKPERRKKEVSEKLRGEGDGDISSLLILHFKEGKL